jgi:predicted AAA+ superfamily ATPase
MSREPRLPGGPDPTVLPDLAVDQVAALDRFGAWLATADEEMYLRVVEELAVHAVATLASALHPPTRYSLTRG